jgi:NifU-like protein involved in Fe-S cluster formation
MDEKQDEFESLVNQIQEEIEEQEKIDFSDYALELARNPYKYGKLSLSDTLISKRWTGPCGDTMIFHLDIRNDIIIDASFEVIGCAVTSMVGSQVIKMIENKSVAYAKSIKDEDIIKALKKFPEDSYHCATLAVTTLKMLLDNYNE